MSNNFRKLLDGLTDRTTDMGTYRAAIAAKNALKLFKNNKIFASIVKHPKLRLLYLYMGWNKSQQLYCSDASVKTKPTSVLYINTL